LLHEEFFVYLEEARRVLRPGGRIIFSFLDLRTQACRPIFTQMTSKVRAKHSSPHLDMFMGRDDIPTWAELLGLNLIDVVSGDDAGILPSSSFPKFESYHAALSSL
jgi:hypothetical protein